MDRMTILYGFQAEPTPIEKSNLSRIPLLKRRFPGVEIGYLDHAAGDSEDQIHLFFQFYFQTERVSRPYLPNEMEKLINYLP